MFNLAKRITLIFILVANCNLLFAMDEWSTASKWAYSAVLISLAADGLSTHEMLKDPQIHENNPFLGKSPSDEALTLYLVGYATTLLGLAWLLPDHARPFFLGTVAIVEFNAARHNLVLCGRF